MKKNSWLKFVSVLLPLQILSIASIATAEANELFDLCSRFPHNSKCEGYTAPVSLENRSGDNAECLLGNEEEAQTCKVDLQEETLTLYVETGEDLDILDGDKDTEPLAIPLSNIESFSYSEDSKVNTNKVLTFGVIGLLNKDELASLDFLLKPSEAENTENINQLLLVTERDAGIDLMEEIESKTKLTAEIIEEE